MKAYKVKEGILYDDTETETEDSILISRPAENTEEGKQIWELIDELDEVIIRCKKMQDVLRNHIILIYKDSGKNLNG